MNIKEEFHKAMTCLEKQDNNTALILLNQVVEYYNTGKLNEGESKFDSLHQVALHQLGNLHLIQGELDNALQHFQQYIAHYEQTLGDKANDEERNLYHIFIGSKGKALFDQEKFIDAQKEFTKIIDYYHENNKGMDHVCVTSIYFNALCFFRLEDYRPALYFLDMLIKLYQENADNVDEIYYETVFCKVSILLKLNDIDNSLAQLNQSIEFCSKLKVSNNDIVEEFKNFKQHIIDSVNKSAGNA